MREPALRALVVDDDGPTCVLVADILRRAGYEVVTTTRPDEAVRIHDQSGPFHLAVLDVVMPTMTGEVLAGKLRANSPQLRVLFLTGFPGALFQAQPVLWDGQAFLEKPCTDHALLEAVSLLLTGRIPRDTSHHRIRVGGGGDREAEPLL